MPASSGESTVRLLASAALDKKAEGLVILDLQGLSSVADYFLVCGARSPTHLDTIAESVQAAIRSEGRRLRHREGTAKSGWLLLDCGDVVVHMFLEETRAFYSLERLWGDAPVLSVEG